MHVLVCSPDFVTACHHVTHSLLSGHTSCTVGCLPAAGGGNELDLLFTFLFFHSSVLGNEIIINPYLLGEWNLISFAFCYFTIVVPCQLEDAGAMQ